MKGAQITLRHRGIARLLLSDCERVFPGEDSAKRCVDLMVRIIGEALAEGHVVHLEGVGSLSVLPGRTGRRVLGGVIEEAVTDRLRLRIKTALAMSNRLNPGRPKRKATTSSDGVSRRSIR